MGRTLFEPDAGNPPAIVRPAEDLASLLAAASAEHKAGERAERAGLEHYRKAGEALARAKATCGHGKWLDALKRTGIPQQRASEYMRLATGWDKLPPGGTFALKEALRLMAADGPAEGEPGGFVLPDLYPLVAGSLQDATKPVAQLDLVSGKAYAAVDDRRNLAVVRPSASAAAGFCHVTVTSLDDGSGLATKKPVPVSRVGTLVAAMGFGDPAAWCEIEGELEEN